MKTSGLICLPLILLALPGLPASENSADKAPQGTAPAQPSLKRRERRSANIVFIFSDDHSYEAISAYAGAPARWLPRPTWTESPRRVRLDNCFQTNASGRSSRHSDGEAFHLNGFMENEHRFDGSQQTFSKLLQKGVPDGRDRNARDRSQGYDPERPARAGILRSDSDPKGLPAPRRYVTEAVVSKSIDWPRRKDKDKPLLMVSTRRPSILAAPVHLLDEYVGYPEPKNLDDQGGRTPAQTRI